MKLPRFPLESVASMRRHEEDRALELLGAAMKQEDVQVKLHESLKGEWRDSAEALRRKDSEPAFLWVQGQGWREVLERRIEEQRRRVECARQETLKARERWMQARQRREMMDKLRAHHHSAAMAEVRRLEQRDLDEMGSRKKLAWSVLENAAEPDRTASGD